MKYVVICPDGAADWPIASLGNKTPLEAANIPNLHKLAQAGVVGRTQHAPEGMDNGSDICCMALLGFNPRQYHTGRAPIEAKSIGIDLQPDEIAVRCNTVTIENGVMVDYSAGHITTPESRELILDVEKALGGPGRKFYPGVQYRHILVLKKQSAPGEQPRLEAECTAPHNIIGREVESHLPKGPEGKLLLDLMNQSQAVLKDHPVNKARVAKHDSPATQIWLWGHGPRPNLPLFKDTFGISGAMISAVDLLKSLGLYLGLEVLDVPGITGFTDTNYANKGKWAIDALEKHDMVFVHVEAPDECGHMGDEKQKLTALERMDADIVGPIANCSYAKDCQLRILVSPDHSTPCAIRKHATEPIPFLAYGPGFEALNLPYTESGARRSSVSVANGYELMGKFLKASL